MSDFDPDAYLAAKAVAFDPDAYLATKGESGPKLTASGLPQQTGKRFIEPPEEPEAPPDERLTALGVAPGPKYPKAPTAEELHGAADALRARPQVGERFARNIAQGVPVVGTFSDELAAAFQAPLSERTYRDIRDEHRARNAMAEEDAPGESFVTRTAAGFLPIGSLFKGASTAAEIAKRAAGIGFAEGAGRSEREDIPGVLNDAAFNAAVSGGTAGLVSKVTRGAPERVDKKMLEGISRGDAGGAAKDKLFKNLAVKAGDDASELNEVLTRFPGLKKTLAVSGPGAPRKAAEAVQDHLDVIGGKLRPIYDKLDSGPAVPEAQHLFDTLTALRDRVKSEGSTGMADVIERFQQHLAKHYGDGDAILQGTPLPASSLRNLRREVGEIAFAGDASMPTPFKKQAQQLIYGAINDTIEQAAAKTPGVDVAKLRELNRDYSMLKTVLDPLEDRAAKAVGGRHSLLSTLTHAGAPVALGAAGFASHGGHGAIEGVALAAAALAAKKVLGPTVRATDYQLARLAEAARGGSAPAQIAQLGIELGLSRTVAPMIADKLARTILPPDDTQDDHGDGEQDQPNQRALARLVHAAGSGGDVDGAIQQAVASGIAPQVARRIVEISRQTFAGQGQDATADATTGATP